MPAGRDRRVPPLSITSTEVPDAPTAYSVRCEAKSCHAFSLDTTDRAAAQWAAGNHLQSHVRQALDSLAPKGPFSQ